MPRKKFKCSKCDRSFSMARHLGRHMTTTHATKKRKTAVKKAKRRSKKRTMKRLGRPKGTARRLGLANMTLEQLSQVIDAARTEARLRLAALEESIG